MAAKKPKAKRAPRKAPAQAPPRDPYCERAERYARRVVAGEIPASKVTTSCAMRFLKDLEHQADADWPYRFDEQLGGRACEFLEHLPHVEGPLAGEPFKAEDWQCFVQAQIWGWVRKADGLRRFARVEIWCPRGQGKSFFASGNGTYAVAATGEGGAQVATAATTREQAKIVLDVSRRQLELAPELATELGLEVTKHAIFQQRTFSRYRAISSEAKTADGKNLYFAICDELHAHPDRRLYDILLTGLGKRKEGTMFVISTAGDNTSGIGFERYTHAKKIAQGVVEDERTFVAMWEADEDDQWDDEATWAKANPNLRVSVDIEQLRSEAATARVTASARSSFFTRRLNRWVGASRAFVNLAHLDSAWDETWSREDFTGEPCFLGLDLASGSDLCCISYVWKRKVEEETHYWIAVDSYLPAEAANESNNASYRGWVAEGFIKTNEGNEIDYRWIESELGAAADKYFVRELAHDEISSARVVAQALDGRMQPVKVPTTYLHMTAPMREFESGLAGGRFHIEPNPCLRWMASNLIAKFRGEQVRPDKEHAENKIDGMVAIFQAMNRAMASADSTPYADGEGLRVL